MREFRQKHGRAGERYWSVSFESPPGVPPETIVTEWGSVNDGKKKQHGTTKNKPGSKGKMDTRAYVSAADNASFGMDRMIRKKLEEGYVEVGLDGRPLVGGPIDDPVYESGMPIPFHEPLPKNLCFSKPKNTVTNRYLAELEANNNLLLTRKVNGMMVIVQLMEDETVKLYTRRMDDITAHFPHLVMALHRLALPTEGIMLFEAFLGEGKTKKDLLRVQSVMRSKPDRAVKLQEEGDWMKFYLFRLPVWEGVYLEQELNCEENCYAIENTFADLFLEYRDEAFDEQFLFVLENFEGSIEEAMLMAEEHGYEGWVGYKRTAKLGEYSHSYHGKPDRPSCCFKLKASYEDDFIAYYDPEGSTKRFPMGSFGTGKNTGLLGTLSLYQMDPHNNDQVYVCEVGSGFTDKQRLEMSQMEYPTVVTVEYTSRQYTKDGDATNALEFPRFSQIHPDKQHTEVYNPKIQRA